MEEIAYQELEQQDKTTDISCELLHYLGGYKYYNLSFDELINTVAKKYSAESETVKQIFTTELKRLENDN